MQSDQRIRLSPQFSVEVAQAKLLVVLSVNEKADLNVTWQICRFVGSHIARLVSIFFCFAFGRLRHPEMQTGSHK